MPKTQLGGSFAPPLSDERLQEIATLIDGVQDAQIKDGMRTCYDCVAKWWEIPESKGTELKLHGSGGAFVTDLDEESKEALFDLIPWEDELDVIQARFDRITDKATRNAAFLLLWFVKELNLDREPTTNDRLRS